MIITIFMGSGWPMFSENTLLLYQEGTLQLRFIFYEMATGDVSRAAQISH